MRLSWRSLYAAVALVGACTIGTTYSWRQSAESSSATALTPTVSAALASAAPAAPPQADATLRSAVYTEPLRPAPAVQHPSDKPRDALVAMRRYSQADVVALLAKRHGGPLYYGSSDTLVRVRYAPTAKKILLDARKEPTGLGVVHELGETDKDSALKKKLAGNFTATVMVISCGDGFGDDACDQYSPLNEPIRAWTKISTEDKAEYLKYLQVVGKLLDKTSR